MNISLKEFREKLEIYIDLVSKGESITVFRCSIPLFQLTPIDVEGVGWESVVDFTAETGRGVPTEELVASMKTMRGLKL